MEATVDPLPRGPDWMPITPKTGSLFHADSQTEAMSHLDPVRELSQFFERFSVTTFEITRRIKQVFFEAC